MKLKAAYLRLFFLISVGSALSFTMKIPMTKTSIILVATLLLATLSQAQEYTFKVLVNKGKNEVKSGGAWQPVKTGSSLNSSDEIRLVDNAYVGLLHANGRPLELKFPGNYKVVDLSAKVGKGNSVLNKYTDFILSSNEIKSNRLAASGHVYRSAEPLKVRLPKENQTAVFSDTVLINWVRDTSVDSYVVSVKSFLDEEVFQGETTDTTMVIDLTNEKLSDEAYILVEVYPKGKPERKQDPSFVLKRMDANEKARVTNQINEVLIALPEKNALTLLLLAGFYEGQGLLVDASSAYGSSIRMAPDVAEIREAYERFLVRNKIAQ